MENKYKRFLVLLATLVLLVSALNVAVFAAETDEPVCYEHGDVNGDGVVDSNDAIHTLYHSLFGMDKYPVNQDCDFTGDSSVDSEDAIYVLYASVEVTAEQYPLEGMIHSYYDPAWQWDMATMTATAVFKCGCGEEHTFSSEDITVTTTETKATCVAAGSMDYVAKISFGGVEYSNTKKVTIPAGNGHQMEGTQNCVSGSECVLCDYELPALGHSWVLNEEKSTPATCKAQAVRVYECACGETKSVTLEGTAAHTYTYMAGQDLAKGDCKFVKQYKCSACGEVIEGTAESDTYYKHTYTATLTKEATCSQDGEKTYTCGDCGHSYKEVIAKNESHTWDAGVTDNGVTTHTCGGCGATKTSVSVSNDAAVDKAALESAAEVQLDNGAAIALDEATLGALADDQQIQISVSPADLNDTGLTEEQKAQVGDNTVYDFNMSYEDGTAVTEFAGEVTISLPYTLAEGEDIDSIDVWYIDDEGNLTQVFGTYSNGYVTFTTTHFSYYTVTRLTPAKRCERYGHILVESDKQATCTEDGYHIAVCQRCGVELAKEVMPMLGHSYKDTENAKAPTCEEDGYSEQKCELCGDIQKGEVPALGHDMVLDEAQSSAASCTAPGKEVYVCAHNCGHVRVDEKPQLEHVYKESENKEADCNNKGHKKNKCELCGAEEVVSESAPTGHDYLAENAIWEWAPDYSSATVTLVCSYNDQHTKTLNAVVTDKAVSASCTTGGSIVYTATASFNKYTYTDTRADTTEALGHKPGTEWVTNANQHYHLCSICGGKADAVAHTWGEPTVIQAATCNAAGSQSVVCTICGYKTEQILPATGKHTYVNGICSVCGYNEGDCEHLRLHKVPLDVSGYDVCGDFELWYDSCDCGERKVLGYAALDCVWGEETFKEAVAGDGTKYQLYCRTCTVCGLTIESGTYPQLNTEECTQYYREYFRFSQNGTTILEYSAIPYGMPVFEHPCVVEKSKVDLSTYGLCGGVLEIHTCPCGKAQSVGLDQAACEWVYDEESSGERFNVYVCKNCGVQQTTSFLYTEDKEHCESIENYTCTYSKNGEELYTYTEKHFYTMHTYKTTDYVMDGTSCEDGITVTNVCESCGMVNKYYSTWHEHVKEREIDVSATSMCADRIVVGTCACEKAYSNWWYESDSGTYCDWTQVSYDEDTESSVWKCDTCGTVRTQTVSYSEKGENCIADRTMKAVFTDQKGDLITIVESRWDTEHHNMQKSYILKGESCTDGVTIVSTCTDCGYEWTSNSNYHIGVEQATYDLSSLDMCGDTSVTVYRCPCGEDTWMDWENSLCNFNWISGDRYTTTEGCASCGTIRTVRNEEGAEIDSCHTNRKRTYTYSKKGKESISFGFDDIQERHRYVYELTLMEGATDCTGGVTIKRTCLTCGKTEDYGTTHNHSSWPIAREIVAEGKLCGTLELMTISCACGQEGGMHFEWLDNNNCEFYWHWSEELNAEIATCVKCGVYYTEDWEETPVAGESCQYLHTEKRTYFKDGVELDSAEATWRRDRHKFEAVFQMQGETCQDGYTVTETCAECGVVNEYNGVHYDCETWVVEREKLYDGTDICGELYLNHWSCPCGQHQSYDMDYDCEFSYVGWDDEIGESIYACTKCGLKRYGGWRYVQQPNTCMETVTLNQTYLLKDQVIANVQKTWEERDHEMIATFQMLGETCDDGYYVTETCKYCGVSYEGGLHTGHSHWQTASYHLVDYGMCGGEIWQNSCPCGQYSDWSWNNGCNYNYTGNVDPDTGIEERYCAACQTYSYSGEISELDTENCLRQGTFYFKAIRDGETKENFTGPVQYEDHTYLATNFALTNPEGDCDDGYSVDLTCAFCGDSRTESSYYHGSYNTEILNLNDYETCGGYVYSSRCACGENSYISYDYACDMNYVKSWDEQDANGISHYFEEHVCSECGLTRIYESYEVMQKDSCEGVRYYSYTFQLGDTLNETLNQSEIIYDHNYDYTYSLRPGCTDCEDGISVRGVCKDCGYVNTYNTTGHRMNYVSAIDLTAYGSICGGDLNFYQCPCGQMQRYDFDEELQCDLDRRYVSNWIADCLHTGQYTTEWWQDSYSYSYTFTCAVTDPTACGLKIRMSEYWLKEGCEAVEYQTWQLGYDAATETCQEEITIATGDRHAFHNYTYTNINETQEDGTRISGEDYTCPDCGSYFTEKYYYENDEQVRRTLDAVNTLDNGEMKERHEVTEYGFEYGDYRYRTLERDEYIYGNGREYWQENAWTYDFTNGCRATRTYKDSDGDHYVYYEEAHMTSWDYEVTKQPTCSQFGVQHEWNTCQVCDEIVWSYDYDIEPTRHYWNWNSDLELYVCSTCGLENVNGASGSITLEDMSETYGNNTNYVIGYWNSGNIQFNPYVGVILDDVADENNELVLTGITFSYWTVKDNGITALVFDQAATQAAAEAAIANAGYTGSYAIRISFVPVNSDDTLDYAITFDSQMAA